MNSEISSRDQIAGVADPEHLRDLVGRIAASRHFRRSQRLRSFLEFVCTETVEGRSEQINEHLVGHHVFGRPTTYDPGSDNIVRVEARELRKRLAAFFEEEGAREPIVIRVPKGGYVPCFEPASIDEPAEEENRFVPAAVGSWSTKQVRLGILTAMVATLLGSVAFGVLPIRIEFGAEGVQAAQRALPPRFAAFWDKVFNNNHPTVISLADSNLALLQDLRGESISFAEYSNGRYLTSLREGPRDTEVSRIHSEIAARYYTSVGDARALARLSTLNRHQIPTSVRFARDLSTGDLKTRNAILLGSSRSNPWVELLDKQRRFSIGYDSERNIPYVRDSKAATGQPSLYLCDVPGQGPYTAYGMIAAVPNLDDTGVVLLVAGTNGQGTEAAGEFLTDPQRFEEFLEKIKWKDEESLPQFEVVLRLVTVEGSPIRTQILDYSVPDPGR